MACIGITFTILVIFCVALLLSHMGSLFGSTAGYEAAHYKVIRSSDQGYEVRTYSPVVIASVPYSSSSEAFRTLAGYIGVMGDPQNSRQESIEMTVPVASDSERMWFYMPSVLSTTEACPTPLNKDVEISTLPARTEAVLTFSGSMTDSWSAQKAADLLHKLKIDGREVPAGERKWFTCAFNPPWTIPYFRTNEIHIPVPAEGLKITQ